MNPQKKKENRKRKKKKKKKKKKKETLTLDCYDQDSTSIRSPRDARLEDSVIGFDGGWERKG